MANEAIGHIKCHLCGSPKVRVSLMKNWKLCTTCSCCHFQGQARGPHADMYIRQIMTPVAKALPSPPEPAPGMEIAPKPAPEIKPAPVKAAPKVEPAPTQEPEADKPVKQKSTWDIF